MAYIQDIVMDMQGFASGEVVQKQLSIMSACFDGLCHEVHIFQPAAANHIWLQSHSCSVTFHVSKSSCDTYLCTHSCIKHDTCQEVLAGIDTFIPNLVCCGT